MNTYSVLSRKSLIIANLLLINIAQINAQMSETSNFSYQINQVQKHISISPSHLNKAISISDLNHYYKSDWVKEYKSVAITTIHNGTSTTTNSKNDILTEDQKRLIAAADRNTDISVVVHYIPDNNLSVSTIQEMDFEFRIDPEIKATYTGGDSQLDAYITKHIMTKVNINDIAQYQVAAVKFTIDEEGRVVDAGIAKSSNNKKSDDVMLKTICEMPNWQSAQYADGTLTKQDFVLTVGDHYSCTMNLLDIKSEVPPAVQKDQ